ncbi:hypothetical protein [Bradyrhizobium neotropicale]|uniref:Uncharacterized protein n=1 Tax=Bradyrhizobium neotropicale TaxID=1497615 RepID=A0A176ZHD6_9BRAD|nr:hypothetical protein [Bradyrhizobium neotropicale]OAF19196.1 hypothetical protein AXW67_37670 [Bradyrhizobium neotropicale]
MVAITDFFDSYARQARLFPGLLMVFPPLMTALAWFPQLVLSNVGTTLLTIAVSCGLLYALGSWARTRGKNIEDALLAQWGGWPTTLKLRHAGSLDPSTLARYHDFLKNNVPHWQVPTPAEQESDVAKADGVYGSAVKWLKEKTRKGFPLVEKENAQYGFRRNLLGIRPIGIAVCGFAAIASIAAILAQTTGLNDTALWAVFSNQRSEVWAAIAIDLLALIAWFAVVNIEWVRQAADQYADALLAACDQLNARNASAPPGRAGTRPSETARSEVR